MASNIAPTISYHFNPKTCIMLLHVNLSVRKYDKWDIFGFYLTKHNKKFVVHFLTIAPGYIGTSQHWNVQGPVSIFDNTIYCKILHSLEAARFVLLIVRSLCDLTGNCCRCACQIAKRCDNLDYQFHGFETSRYLMIGRLIGSWNGAQLI